MGYGNANCGRGILNRERWLQTYVASIAVVTAGVVWWSCFSIAHVSNYHSIAWLLSGLAFLAMGAVASRSQVYFGPSSTVAMGTIPQVAALLVLPTPVAVLAIMLSKLLSEVSIRIQTGRRPLMAIVVNVGGAVLANLAAILTFGALDGQQYLWSNAWKPVLAFPALISLAVAYHLVDVLLVVVAISLSSSESPLAVFSSTFRSVLIPSLSLVLVGVIFALLWHASWVLFPLVLVPVWYSSRSFANLARQRQDILRRHAAWNVRRPSGPPRGRPRKGLRNPSRPSRRSRSVGGVGPRRGGPRSAPRLAPATGPRSPARCRLRPSR